MGNIVPFFKIGRPSGGAIWQLRCTQTPRPRAPPHGLSNGSNRAPIGPFPDFWRIFFQLAAGWRHLATPPKYKIGRISANFGPIRPGLVSFRLISDPGHDSGHVGAVGGITANMAGWRPLFSNFGRSSGNFGPIRAQLGFLLTSSVPPNPFLAL